MTLWSASGIGCVGTWLPSLDRSWQGQMNFDALRGTIEEASAENIVRPIVNDEILASGR
jgi:hypothetical protein